MVFPFHNASCRVYINFIVYDRTQLENLFEIPDRQAHDNKPYSSVSLQDESADSSLVILGAVLRGKTVLVLTQNDGLFVWYVLQHVYSNNNYLIIIIIGPSRLPFQHIQLGNK